MRIQPDTDNCPFFFNYLKPEHYIGKAAGSENPIQLSGLHVQVALSHNCRHGNRDHIFTHAAHQTEIFIPFARPVRFRWGYILYFACLGFGYMLIEIPLIQKFILFLGQPLYAIAVILSSLLIFSGIGSLLAGAFKGTMMHGRLRIVLVVLCVLLAVLHVQPAFYF